MARANPGIQRNQYLGRLHSKGKFEAAFVDTALHIEIELFIVFFLLPHQIQLKSIPTQTSTLSGATKWTEIFVVEWRLTGWREWLRYTWGSAYACFRDAQLGTLWPSKFADFVVFSDNLLTHTASTNPVVLATFVAGVRVYPASWVYRRRLQALPLLVAVFFGVRYGAWRLDTVILVSGSFNSKSWIFPLQHVIWYLYDST